MKFLRFVALLLTTAIVSPAAAQDYWEYNDWTGEWTHHFPQRGLRYEYGDDGVDVEEQGYEWEAGEGYHEEEWYDPSDWFNDNDTVDYENGYDYDDDYYYDGLNDDYDYTDDYDYDYGLDNENAYGADYEYNQRTRGRVVGLERMSTGYGAPQRVRLRLRTDDGETRTVQLGNDAYVSRYLPRLEPGDEVIVGGEFQTVDGRRVFKAKEIRAEDRRYLIPEDQYQRRIEGSLVGLRKVMLRDGSVQGLVAKIRPKDGGKEVEVMLGQQPAVERFRRIVRPGSRVEVNGYIREMDGRRTFIAQRTRVLGQQGQRADGHESGQQQAQRQQRAQQQRGQQRQQSGRQEQQQRAARRDRSPDNQQRNAR